MELVDILVLETSAKQQCGFESHLRYIICLDSSEVEQAAVNRQAVGSNPSQDAKRRSVRLIGLGHSPFTGKLTGSSPVRSTKVYRGVDWRWHQLGLISPTTRVRFPPPQPKGCQFSWLERLICIQKVIGSTPVRSTKNASLAQLVELPPCKRMVVGSNPTGSSNAAVAQLVEHNLAKVRVAGSNPVCRSIRDNSSIGRASSFQVGGCRFESCLSLKWFVSRVGYNIALSLRRSWVRFPYEPQIRSVAIRVSI